MRLLIPLLIISLFMLFVVSSVINDNTVYEQNHEVQAGIWNSRDIQKFEVEMYDTLGSFNVHFNMINTPDYPFANLWLFIKITAPGGEVFIDTLERPLTDQRGRWLAVQTGDLLLYQIPVKYNVSFPKQGTYIFEFEQAMRKENLEGIIEFGLKIEEI